jgi:ergothioneine biosynthesis protein EgtB
VKPQVETTATEELECGDAYRTVRERSIELCAPLQIEDYGVQPMEDASPPKWHLAHTTWFFETFILKAFVPAYQPYHEQFEYLFNSYYNGVGTPFPRPDRGSLSRPTVAEILDYRRAVDAQLHELLARGTREEILQRLRLGLHHEQQHQELLLTDLKYNFGHNPLYPVYGGGVDRATPPGAMAYIPHDGGVIEVGAKDGFSFDNESPRHPVLLQPFRMAERLVTNEEYLEFMDDGGYARPDLWLSEGWTQVKKAGWQAPLYWRRSDGGWHEYRLDGLHPLDKNLPVVHVSAHEAFAYAAWCGARLPTEFEWEAMAEAELLDGTFQDSNAYHPRGLSRPAGVSTEVVEPRQWYGDVWQWTSSSYGPYPGYRALSGTLGEYNGKFMSSQLVLRGGSCATPQRHMRPSYRNFFYPPDRWQFSGIRLAKDDE